MFLAKDFASVPRIDDDLNTALPELSVRPRRGLGKPGLVQVLCTLYALHKAGGTHAFQATALAFQHAQVGLATRSGRVCQ